MSQSEYVYKEGDYSTLTGRLVNDELALKQILREGGSTIRREEPLFEPEPNYAELEFRVLARMIK